jgi:hypothetical protein
MLLLAIKNYSYHKLVVVIVGYLLVLIGAYYIGAYIFY